ncbi:MAG: hypothetical protein J2P22_07230 [Nocardioides sp.]|nr:hypothetical protein [Nocardioides sp.]
MARRVLLVLVAALVAAMVAGCSRTSTTMMGHGSRAGTGSGFGSMMSAVPHGYRMSRPVCTAPTSRPGKTVYVMLGDMGMTRMMRGAAPLGAHMMLRAVPSLMRAGQVGFVVANMGWRIHEMVVLPLAPGQPAGERVPGADGRVDETGSLGEASATCGAGAGDGITPGGVGWVTLDLPAGRYELVCNLPNHYADGMHQLLIVR